jgi:23S rRNA (cytosine1962-C5)-methyltransferase
MACKVARKKALSLISNRFRIKTTTLQMPSETINQYPEMTLARGKDKRLRNGHLWIFSNELLPCTDRPGPGEIVTVKTSENRIAGIGFYHPNSLIAVRLLSRKPLTIDRAFFTARLQRALQAREPILETTNAVRLVHAESDGLPGLVVDRYGDGLVLQILSAGMEKQRDIVVDVLRELLDPRFVILRNDHHMREREGLAQEKQFLIGDHSEIPVTITENSVSYLVDPLEGQKTGFYIDQRDHRMVFRRFVRAGDRVLDAFCHYGGFAMHAALAGAGEVLAVDDSETVLDFTTKNIRQNGLDHAVSTLKADLMKWLPEAAAGGKERFNVINLDPPNFAANRKSVGPALRGYRKLHRAALEMLAPGGILATASCSHHITEDAFLESVVRACRDSRRRVQMVYRGGHALDHPVLPEMPETGYLKFFIFRVVDID